VEETHLTADIIDSDTSRLENHSSLVLPLSWYLSSPAVLYVRNFFYTMEGLSS